MPYFENTGRRKTATARVRVTPGGSGQIVVNERKVEEYFTRPGDMERIMGPLKAAQMEGRLNITVLVKGGGPTGQVDAVRHGIARALVHYNEELRPTMRQGGFLSRDPREKERKKPGLKKARKAPTFTKR